MLDSQGDVSLIEKKKRIDVTSIIVICAMIATMILVGINGFVQETYVKSLDRNGYHSGDQFPCNAETEIHEVSL